MNLKREGNIKPWDRVAHKAAGDFDRHHGRFDDGKNADTSALVRGLPRLGERKLNSRPKNESPRYDADTPVEFEDWPTDPSQLIQHIEQLAKEQGLRDVAERAGETRPIVQDAAALKEMYFDAVAVRKAKLTAARRARAAK